jgi:hypothetical protein
MPRQVTFRWTLCEDHRRGIYFLPAIGGWLLAKFTGAALPLQRGNP